MMKDASKHLSDVFNAQKLLHALLVDGGCSRLNALEIMVHPIVYDRVTVITVHEPDLRIKTIEKLAARILSRRDIIKEFIHPDDDRKYFIQQLMNMTLDGG